MITEQIMNRMVYNIAKQQNEVNKLNAGSIREVINLVLNAFACEIMIGTKAHDNYIQEGDNMPAKKKASAKKAKPTAKPMPKKK